MTVNCSCPLRTCRIYCVQISDQKVERATLYIFIGLGPLSAILLGLVTINQSFIISVPTFKWKKKITQSNDSMNIYGDKYKKVVKLLVVYNLIFNV